MSGIWAKLTEAYSHSYQQATFIASAYIAVYGALRFRSDYKTVHFPATPKNDDSADFLNTPEFKALFEEAAAPAVAANSGKH